MWLCTYYLLAKLSYELVRTETIPVLFTAKLLACFTELTLSEYSSVS